MNHMRLLLIKSSIWITYDSHESHMIFKNCIWFTRITEFSQITYNFHKSHTNPLNRQIIPTNHIRFTWITFNIRSTQTLNDPHESHDYHRSHPIPTNHIGFFQILFKESYSIFLGGAYVFDHGLNWTEIDGRLWRHAQFHRWPGTRLNVLPQQLRLLVGIHGNLFRVVRLRIRSDWSDVT